MLEKIHAISPGILGEPAAVLVFCIDRSEALRLGGNAGRDLHSVMDIAHAAQNVCLQATELGIGSVCVMSFNHAAAATLLDLPASVTADYVIALGYPEGSAQPRRKRTVEDSIISWWKEQG